MSQYTKEVRNYIFDSYPYTEAVWQAVKSLRQTKHGLPASNWKEKEPGVFLWAVADHQILYERNIDERILKIFVMKLRSEE
ncbi:MAG: hypothetical protein DYG89_51340 [Caldilinea sp. CFX5]|nr:hypothetical protein [Caldilinea sp. CFX5]